MSYARPKTPPDSHARQDGPVATGPTPEVPILGAHAYVAIKCWLERSVAVCALPLALPVLAALAVLLKCTSEGPVFYSQMRLGRSGRLFRMYKLRTMTHCCEAETGPVWSVRGDPRVTKTGRWLRDTHLDELPQLWNVLRGEMSLIGPRPERPEIAAVIERSLPEFRGRLQVRPGITGLAQMQQPADSDLHAVRHKLAGDLLYIQKLGPVLDGCIVLATVCHFLGHVFTTASLRLVRSFTPRHPGETSHRAPDYSLSMAGRGLHGRAVAAQDELSKAA